MTLRATRIPAICVWELTLACNAACVHCGSTAGPRRSRELSTEEALAVCDALARLGSQHVTLSGGEPLLRPDWPTIAQRLVSHGIEVDMISNGLSWTDKLAEAARASGMQVVSLSIDGPAAVHDRLRGVRGGFERAMHATLLLQHADIRVGAVTQVCAWNVAHLREIEEVLVERGFAGWQLQLTMSLGRCEAIDSLPLPPDAVPEVARFVLEAAARGRIPVYAGDNIGWMTREEPRLRSARRPCNRVYVGCQAGLSVLGIASDGAVRGCLSLPSQFDEGNLRDRPLEELWHDETAFAYNRGFEPSAMTGDCAACPFKKVCRGGCKALAWASQRDLRCNPYCLRRQEEPAR